MRVADLLKCCELSVADVWRSVVPTCLNIGIGWMVPLGVHVGIKLEARGYGILLNHNGALFCGGNSGCTVAIKGTALFEGEVLAGLAARF